MTEKGIGNGVSLVIFGNIMLSLPFQALQVEKQVADGIASPFGVGLLLAMFVGTIYGIVLITQGQRKIPIQHAKRVIGMRQTGGGSSFLPIKVNTAGVIPIIFAISMMMFPAQIIGMFPKAPLWLQHTARNLSPGQSWWATLLYAGLIVAFTYFYTAIVMNVQDMSDNLKKYGNNPDGSAGGWQGDAGRTHCRPVRNPEDIHRRDLSGSGCRRQAVRTAGEGVLVGREARAG